MTALRCLLVDLGDVVVATSGKSREIDRRFACACAGAQDRLRVRSQDANPVCEILGMTEVPGDGELGAEKCTRQFGDELLERISDIAEVLPELAREAMLRTAPMTVLMQRRPVVVLWRLELLELRQRDCVGRR